MKIGELASRTGCPVQTIRFYETEGLLQTPERGTNNYRDYGQAHLDRLSFILRCRSLDMAHEEIRVLLRLQDEPTRPCDEVNELLEAHARHVEDRISELKILRRQIKDIRDACAGGVCIGECGALDSLRRHTGATPAKQGHLKGVHRQGR